MGEIRERELLLTYENQEYSEALEYVYYPIYLECYQNCIRNIFTDFVRYQNEKSNCKGSFEYVCRDNASKIEAFLGRRGTGKSTAMIEFCKILESLNERERRRWWLEKSIQDADILEDIKNKGFKFKLIDVVDAGNLEDKEDLFELILAAIFKDYQKQVRYNETSFENYGCENKEVIQLFSSIMDGYYSIKNAKREEFGDSYVARLKSMSSSIDIRMQINKLLTKIFDKIYSKEDNCFLVIAIDDLDINVEHGYEMLEQLHKYFFLPNVIILLSADLKQLEYVCRYHYIRSFVHDTAQSADGIMEQSRNLAKDYITKVLPINMRVYMPKFYSSNRNILINEKFNFKTYIINKIANKTKIFYDVVGTKKHFIEVKNVRELVSYSRFIDSLADVDSCKTGKKYLELYDQNIEQYHSDFESRIATEILSELQKKQYDNIMDKRLEKQIVSIHEFMYNEIVDNDGLKGLWGEKSITYDVDNYRYGDLLYEIYEYGRIDEKNKGMIKCFLASLTIQMQKEKIHYLNSDNENRSKTILYKLLGNGVANEWLAEMLPELNQSDSNLKRVLSVKWGAFNDSAARNVKFDFAIGGNIFTIYHSNEEILNFIKDIGRSKLIPNMECFAMFLKPSGDNGEWVDFKLSWDEYKEDIELGLVNENIEFDILGFIRKSFDWKKQIMCLHDKIQSAIYDFIIRELGYENNLHDYKDNEIEKMIKHMISRCSILNKKWDDDISAFPFYNLDLSYNVLKRARRNLKRENKEIISSDECYEYIKKVYKEIANELNREDVEFGKIGLKTSYMKTFTSFPFIKAFLNGTDELGESFAESFGKNIKGMTYNLTFGVMDQAEGE